MISFQDLHLNDHCEDFSHTVHLQVPGDTDEGVLDSVLMGARYRVEVQLLPLSLVVNGDGAVLEGNVLAGVVFQAVGTYGGSSSPKNNGTGWL